MIIKLTMCMFQKYQNSKQYRLKLNLENNGSLIAVT